MKDVTGPEDSKILFVFLKLSCSVFPKLSLPSFPPFIPMISVQH